MPALRPLIALTAAATVLTAACSSPSPRPATGTGTSAAATSTTVAAPTSSVTPTPEDRVAALINATPAWEAHFGHAGTLGQHADGSNRGVLLAYDTCRRLDANHAEAVNELGRWAFKAGYSESAADTAVALDFLTAAIPLQCPQHDGVVAKVRAGEWTETVSDGVHLVKKDGLAPNDLRLSVTPGRYTITGAVTGCYWENSRPDGTIRKNQYATAATTITVTILPGDGAFTSRGCGTWTQVR